MNTHRTSSTALAAVIAMILAVPSSAWAGEGRDDDHGPGWNKGGGNKGGQKSNEHYNTHYNNRYYGHYAGRGRYYPHYYPSYRCSTCGKNNHHNNNNNNNDKLWIGLLGGGILGYGLHAYQHRNTSDQDYYPQANSAPPPPPEYANTASINPCLQEREYRTKIMVGGKQVEGYGTACLQPDGSWRYGAAQPASY
jgi:hypothetical protein